MTGDHVFEAQWKKVSEEKDDEEKVDKEEDNEEKVDKEKTQKHSSHDDDDDDDDSHHSSSKSAPTGDSSNAALWITLVLLAALGVVGTIIYRRRNRK